MIKELLNSNKQLRDVIDLRNSQLEKFQVENESLQNENQDLRDKIEIIGSLIKSDSNLDPRQMDLYKVI